ncbi:MAG: acetate kinase [Alphaproteobacteria bacterium]|nr:acetate kinase [Alphaproteobacteria bacterium]
MIVLVINCGSSSIKYQLFDMRNEAVLAKGLMERIGMDKASFIHQPAHKDRVTLSRPINDHGVGIRMVLDSLVDPTIGVIESLNEIAAVGHRVLHGGMKFSDSVLITPDVIEAIEECVELGPLHNPANILGIKACEKLMPDVPQIAVFDTGFHQTMPPHAYLYGLPYEAFEKYGVRRYGFHGTSHRYVSQRALALMGGVEKARRIITCHLGNGASVAAILNGCCVDTSMGLTPLEGLVMGTRCGDIDPAIIPFLMKKTGMSPEEIDAYMNKKSGLLGLSGISNDVRDIEEAALQGHNRANIALEVYVHSIRKYIGSYAATMGGVDAIVFTAGLGENSISMRSRICHGLEFLGAYIDTNKNSVYGKETEISTDSSPVKIFVIPTNEELVIARDSVGICAKLQNADQSQNAALGAPRRAHSSL